MLYTTQCHHPLPVGASGSYTITAKLFVPAGAPLHTRAGETFLPVQPKLLNTCASAMGLPPWSSGLVSLNCPSAAKVIVALKAAVIRKARRMGRSPLRSGWRSVYGDRARDKIFAR